MASPGSVQAAPAVPTSEPRHSTRLVLATVGLAILAAVAIFVGGRGWAGPHSVTAEGTPTDTFDRSAGAGLGSTDDGRPWQTPAGPWTIDRGRALPLGANPMPTAWFAVTEGSGERGAIGVTVAVPQDGAGLVLRYQDPQNYWSFTASPSGSGSVIRLIVSGVTAREENVASAVTEPGTQIEVRFDGNWMDFRLNGTRVAGMYDPTLAHATGVGLVAGSGAAISARFDDFYAVADG